MNCPNCGRNIVSKDFRRRNGCRYCVPEIPTKYCSGIYEEKEICKCKKPKHQNWYCEGLEICAKCINYILGN